MPRKSNIDSLIRARTDAFATELASMVRESALETVQSAVAGLNLFRRGPGRPRKFAAAPRPGRSAKAARAAGRRAGKRAKRSTAQVDALAGKLLAHVKSHAGQSIEQIGKAMRQPTKVLKLPVTKLIAAKALKTKGQKRGTKYFAT
jgi:hypothetical protein